MQWKCFERAIMESMSTSQFVEELPVLKTFYEALPEDNYRAVPDSWFVAVTDVVQSRAAIEAGKFKAVNMAGVAMITGIMNALDHQKIPYIFGGDGAAIAFSPDDYELVKDVLSKTRTWVSDELSLELRAAIVPVKDIRAKGCDVKVAGLFVSQAIINFAFIGRGVALAEILMKQGEYEVMPAKSGEYPDLTGLSCRWMPIEKKGSKIISMIVEAYEGKASIPADVLGELLKMINSDTPEGHPAPEDEIKFKWPVEGVDLEAKATGMSKAKLYLIAFIALILNKTGWSMGDFDPAHYRKQLSLNTDYRKIQDGIRMTLSLQHEKVSELRAFLENQRDKKALRFGLSEQESAVLTCFVPSIASDDHYHFLDGAGGGYALAADNLQ
jgi:hypothetical protein